MREENSPYDANKSYSLIRSKPKRKQLGDRRTVVFQDALFQLVAEEDAHGKSNGKIINIIYFFFNSSE